MNLRERVRFLSGSAIAASCMVIVDAPEMILPPARFWNSARSPAM